jgi:hypothetical protein
MNKDIFKKSLAVAIIVLFLGVGIASSININIVKASNDSDYIKVTTQARESEMTKEEPIALTIQDGPVEVIDQQQVTNCYWGVAVYLNRWEAQSFTPTLESLTKVRVCFFKTAYHVPSGINLTVHIRASLTGDDLAILSKDASEITQESCWVEFDFPDITLFPGNKYYIICEANGGTGLENYAWLFNKNNVYDGGEAWRSNDSGMTWSIREDPPDWVGLDYCFITYGLDEPPTVPAIVGPANGKAGRAYNYFFVALDTDRDEVYYFIDWGDNSNSSWIGPYSSGKLITESHTWSENGTYIIKAKARDNYGVESDWGTLSVTMPLDLQINQQYSNQLIFKMMQRVFLNIKDFIK